MAEGLARHYGSDVLWTASAGLTPIHRVDPFTIKVLQDRNIDISNSFPKGLDDVDLGVFQLIVNMSGQKLPSMRALVEDWNVPDPFTKKEEDFQKTASLLEFNVMRLILQLRLKQHPAWARLSASQASS